MNTKYGYKNSMYFVAKINKDNNFTVVKVFIW